MLIVGFAGALDALGNLASSEFIALVAPLAALLAVALITRGPGDASHLASGKDAVRPVPDRRSRPWPGPVHRPPVSGQASRVDSRSVLPSWHRAPQLAPWCRDGGLMAGSAGSAGYPPRIPPMLAVPAAEIPEPEAAWGAEFKWDGVRAVAYVSAGRLRLLSRSGRGDDPGLPGTG